MTRRCWGWTAALTMLVVLGASGSTQAQSLERDVDANGVLIGAATGAAAGAVLGLVNEEICSPGLCAYLGSVAGGLIGLVIDKHVGHPRPAVPGSLVNDGLGNGALVGALGGAGLVLIDYTRRCGPEPEKVTCTAKGALAEMSWGAAWVSLVGLLIDAAIPSRLQGPAGALHERPQRRLSVEFRLRF